MASRAPEPLLSGFVGATARLMGVESEEPRSLSLRFDRGVLRAALVDGALELELGGDGTLSAEAANLDEDDPWWTVLGQPLCGAWSRAGGDGRREALEL